MAAVITVGYNWIIAWGGQLAHNWVRNIQHKYSQSNITLKVAIEEKRLTSSVALFPLALAIYFGLIDHDFKMKHDQLAQFEITWGDVASIRINFLMIKQIYIKHWNQSLFWFCLSPGLAILYGLLQNVWQENSAAQSFYQTYYTDILQHVLSVVTDTSHTAGK